MVFTVLCLGQLTYAMAIRSETVSLFRLGIFSNSALIFTVAITFVLQLAIIYLPVLNKIFKTQPLTIRDLLFCISISFVFFIAIELEKLIRSFRMARHDSNHSIS